MRYAIISDIHSNLEALQAVLDQCRECGVRKFFCAGDIVGYGANPKECIELVRHHNIVCIAGNHDWAAVGKLDTEYFNEYGKAAIDWTKSQLSKDESDFLSGLDLVYSHKDFTMVHGSLNHPEVFNYLFEVDMAADSFYLMKKNVCFVGHTHVPKIFTNTNKRTDYIGDCIFDVNPQTKYIINVGSVGQPRDGNPKACFCIFDPDLSRVEIRRVDYKMNLTQQKIFQAGLPAVLGERLSVGR